MNQISFQVALAGGYCSIYSHSHAMQVVINKRNTAK